MLRTFSRQLLRHNEAVRHLDMTVRCVASGATPDGQDPFAQDPQEKTHFGAHGGALIGHHLSAYHH